MSDENDEIINEEEPGKNEEQDNTADRGSEGSADNREEIPEWYSHFSHRDHARPVNAGQPAENAENDKITNEEQDNSAGREGHVGSDEQAEIDNWYSHTGDDDRNKTTNAELPGGNIDNDTITKPMESLKNKMDDADEEQDEVHKLLNFKTARILGIVFGVVLIAGLVLSYIQFQNSSDRREHSKYFWLENNIPKGYPDTVYQKKIILMDSSIIRTQDSLNRAMAAHDSTRHDTLLKK